MSITNYTAGPLSIATEAVVTTWTNTTGREVIALVDCRVTGLSAATSKPTWTLRHLTAADVVIGDSDTYTAPRSAVSDGAAYRSTSRPLGPVRVADGEKLQVLCVGLAGDTTVSFAGSIMDAQEVSTAIAPLEADVVAFLGNTPVLTQLGTGEFVPVVSLDPVYDAAKTAAQSGDAMAMTAAERQIITRLTGGYGRVFYVAKSGNDSNDGLSPAAAKLTVMAAHNAASAGDLVFVGVGTFAEALVCTKALTIIGTNPNQTIITTSGSHSGATGSQIRDITFVSTNAPCFMMNGKSSWIVTRCVFNGKQDGLYTQNCANFRVEKCETYATYDGAVFIGDSDFFVSDTKFFSDGSYSSGTPARAVSCSGAKRGHFNRCIFIADRSSLGYFPGVVKAFESQASAESIHLLNCIFFAKSSNVNSFADVYGVDGPVSISGGNVVTYQTGLGLEYSLFSEYVPMTVHACQYDVAKSGGFINSPASDVTGKVLGGGTSTIIAAGVRADDRDGAAIAKASAVTTVLDRLGAWTGSARNTILGALQSLFRKDTDAAVPSDINADLGGGAGAGAANNTTDSAEAIRDAMHTASQQATDKADLLAEIGAAASGGDGDTPVNHNTGGADNLRLVDTSGGGIDNAAIRAYLTSEYAADPTAATLRATSVTGADGRWVSVMMLNAGLAHTIVFSRPGYNAITAEVTP